MDGKKEANKRIFQAQILLERIDDLAYKARAKLSVIGTGLNGEWDKIADLQEKLKTIRYALRDHREGGLCSIDESMMLALEKHAAQQKKKKKRSKR